MTENKKRFTVEIAIHKTREGWANRSIYYINDSLYSAQKTKKVLGASYVVTVPANAIVIGENREKLAEEVCSKMNALHEENKQLKKKLDFFNELNKPYGDLIKENQQLKCINKQLEERLGRSLALDMEECE